MPINYDQSIDEIERGLIGRSYRALLNPKSSTQRKFIAIEYLSQFMQIPEHYKNMSKLYEMEKNIYVMEKMKKVLNGFTIQKKYEYLSELFEEESREFNEEWNQSLLMMNREYTKKINEEFKWRARNT